MYKAAQAAFFYMANMAKEIKSITIDTLVSGEVKKLSKEDGRSFSGMIEYICRMYISASKKQNTN